MNRDKDLITTTDLHRRPVRVHAQRPGKGLQAKQSESLRAHAGGQLVAAVPGRTEGSGAKTRWKREAYCYTPARAPGGTVATWTSVPGAGFEHLEHESKCKV